MKRREFISLLGGVAASPRISDNIHGGGSVCHQAHSDTEVGIYAHRDAAVSSYNRSVLSADGAALTYAPVITALCFSAVQRYGRVWERMDDALCTQQTAADRVHFVIALPMAAIFIASMANSDLPRDVVAATAIPGSFAFGTWREAPAQYHRLRNRSASKCRCVVRTAGASLS